MWIATSLKEFGKLIGAIEDEKDKLLDRSYEQFIVPLENFRKEQIGSVKERKKKFEKQTAKFCASQERYLQLSTKKQDTVLQEADALLEMEHRDFIRAGLEYVCLIQEVQEKKKFEFVEILLGFMYSWLTFYHSGHEVAKDFRPHMTELQTRIQRTRENFNSSREDIHALMRKMLEVRQAKPIDPGTLNKMYTRTGYLFLMEKKALGTTSWNKAYCHYQREGRLFRMIPYNQTAGKIISTETFRLRSCVKRVTESIDKRFCFDLIPEDRPGFVYTFQALSEEDRDLWLDAMDGKEPMYVHPPRPSDANQTYLDEAGFNFIAKCFQVLENRGYEDQGLYRVVGVASKVTKLLTMGLDRRKSEKLNFDDPFDFESKTITSAVKTFFRNLPEPIMTFKLHASFIEAAKLETYHERVNEVQRLVDQLPEPNKRMLEMLMSHLEKVAENSKRNMMTVSNLGVCFGPTLLRAEEETVAAIMDIKFANVIVEILIENWRQILRGETPAQTRRISSGDLQPSLVVLPVTTSPNSNNNSKQFHPPPTASPKSALVSPKRPPPPYPHPPPPPSLGSSQTSLAQAVIYNQGHKPTKMSNNRSPPSSNNHSNLHHSLSNASLSSYNSATWERTLRGSASNLVPPPLGSAPPPSTSSLSPYSSSNNTNAHQRVHASMSNLDHPNQLSPHNHQNIGDPNQPGGPWYGRGDRPPPPVKSRAPLQRQHSAGQTSLLSSNSGGPSTPRSSTDYFPDDGLTNSHQVESLLHHNQQVAPQPFHGNGSSGAADRSNRSTSQSQASSSSSVESLTSTSSSREVSSFDSNYPGDNHANRLTERVGRDDLEQAVREAALSAAQTVAASTATVMSITATGNQGWNSGTKTNLYEGSTTTDGRIGYPDDPYPSRSTYHRGRLEGQSQTPDGHPGRSHYAPSGYPNDQQGLSQEASAANSSSSSSASAVPPIKPRSSYMQKSSAVELRRVRTLYACVGEHDTELSFEPNQIITSIRSSLEPGWLEGCLDGKFGLVPENYVEFIP